MQYCKNCHVKVDGAQDYCPLCQEKLHGEKSSSLFPVIPTAYHRHGFLLKIALFLSVAAGVTCFLINWMFPQKIWWSLYVVAGLFSMWFSLIAGIRKRANVYKNILWQVVILSCLSILWDIFTGWYRWSIEYVLPFLCILAIAIMTIFARIQNLRLQDYLNYLIIDMLFGIAPLVLLLTGQIYTVLPSLFCIGIGILSFACIVIFHWNDLREEICKRLHLS